MRMLDRLVVWLLRRDMGPELRADMRRMIDDTEADLNRLWEERPWGDESTEQT